MGASYDKQKKAQAERNKMQGARIWLPLSVLQGMAYASLPPTAKALLVDLAAQLRARHGEIYNNGDLTTALSILCKCGWKDAKTIRNATHQLEDVSLIVKTRQGQRPRLASLYAVTWLPLNENKKLEITAQGFPLNGYLLHDKVPPIKLTSNVSNRTINKPHRGVLDTSKQQSDHSNSSNTPLYEGFSPGSIVLKEQPSIITNDMY